MKRPMPGGRRVHFWASSSRMPACWSDGSVRRRWRELIVTAHEDEVTCQRCAAWMQRNDW